MDVILMPSMNSLFCETCIINVGSRYADAFKEKFACAM